MLIKRCPKCNDRFQVHILFFFQFGPIIFTAVASANHINELRHQILYGQLCAEEEGLRCCLCPRKKRSIQVTSNACFLNI